MRSRSLLGRALVAGTVAGAGCLAYAAGYEVRAYRLRRLTVPVLPPGAPTLRVLQVTDLHMTPAQKGKREWVRSLAGARAGPRREHRRQPRAPRRRPRGARRARARCSTCPAPSCSAPTTTTARRARTRCATWPATPGTAPGTGPIDLPWGDLVSGLRAGGLGRPDQRASLGRGPRPTARAARRRRPARAARRLLRGRPDRPTTTRTSPSASCTRPTTGSPTRWPPTASRSCSPGTPTAARSASPSTAPWCPTPTSARDEPRGSAGTPRAPCSTSRPGSGRPPTPRSGSPARPRRRSSPSCRRTPRPEAVRPTGLGGPPAAGYPRRASGCGAAW